jgi:hypothetical protein
VISHPLLKPLEATYFFFFAAFLAFLAAMVLYPPFPVLGFAPPSTFCVDNKSMY